MSKLLEEVMKRGKVHRNPLFPHMECDCAYPHDRKMCSRHELMVHGLGKYANHADVDPCECTCHDEHDKK